MTVPAGLLTELVSENETLRARVATLETALREITDSSGDPRVLAHIARAALAAAAPAEETA